MAMMILNSESATAAVPRTTAIVRLNSTTARPNRVRTSCACSFSSTRSRSLKMGAASHYLLCRGLRQCRSVHGGLLLLPFIIGLADELGHPVVRIRQRLFGSWTNARVSVKSSGDLRPMFDAQSGGLLGFSGGLGRRFERALPRPTVRFFG